MVNDRWFFLYKVVMRSKPVAMRCFKLRNGTSQVTR